MGTRLEAFRKYDTPLTLERCLEVLLENSESDKVNTDALDGGGDLSSAMVSPPGVWQQLVLVSMVVAVIGRHTYAFQWVLAFLIRSSQI